MSFKQIYPVLYVHNDILYSFFGIDENIKKTDNIKKKIIKECQIIIPFLSVLSLKAKLITIDIRLNNDKTYIIKNKDDNMIFSYDDNLNINIIPEKILNLIKNIFINNDIMHNCLYTKYQGYNTFYCLEKIIKQDLSNIKLNFNFDTYTKELAFSELFTKKGNYYFFKFYSKSNIKNIIIGTKEINDINNILRKLVSSNKTEEKNGTDVTNVEKQKPENLDEQKSGIGWLGISLIVLLSLIVIYVIYVGFRYYRRKKYQNPSFYYKITEEMFDDITPIE